MGPIQKVKLAKGEVSILLHIRTHSATKNKLKIIVTMILWVPEEANRHIKDAIR